MGHGVLPRSLVQGTRTPYRVSVCVHLHNLISVFGDRVHGVSLDSPSPRETYLDAQIFICLLVRLHLPLRLCPVLSTLGASLYFSVFPNPVNHQLRYPTNLSSPPSNTKLTMAGSAPAAAKDIKSVLENKPLKFKFKTGGASYIAQVHTDRSSYERVKSTRTSSADSISSASTTGSK